MKLGVIAVAAATLTGTLWFGTEESHMALCDALEQVRELEAAGGDALKAAIKMRGGSDDPFGMPSMMTVEGDTGVISVRGSLVSGSAGFFRFFGAVGYDDIKGAITEALNDKNVKRIVLDIDSGGGMVNGVEDAGDFIRKASTIKPIVSFTGGTMGSAAYWVGASADKIFGARTSQVGSVGTLIVTMEMTKALEDEGRKAHIFRYGKVKAMGHPYEKLSAAGEAHFQYLADASGKIFVEYAAERRGTTPEKFQKTMGEGRVLLGEDAAEAGLIDGVMSFEQLMANAKSLDKPKRTAENSRHSAKDSAMKIRAISKAVILALIGGTKVEALGLSTEAANVTGEKPEADDVTALTAEAAEVQAAIETAKNTAVTAAVATATAPLNQKVTDLTAKVTLLEAGAAELTGKVTASAELTAGYAGVLRASIATMSVALGAADATASLQGKELLAAHEALATQFKAKFPTGGIAAVAPSTEKPTTSAVTPPPADFLAAVAGYAQ